MKQYILILLLNFCITLIAIQPESYKSYKKFLDLYKRPITILEIDPGVNPLALALARNYDCTCVLLESLFAQELLTLCTQNNEINVILLTSALRIDEFKRLSECEHFDVVLLRNTHRTCKKNLQELLNALSQLGDYIFIEDQKVNDAHSKKLKQYAFTHNYQLYNALSDDEPLIYLLERKRTSILRTCLVTAEQPEGFYTIESNFETKKFHHHLRAQPCEWQAGITLQTFLMLCGTYPSKEYIRDYLATLHDKPHSDLWLGNLVIQGKKIVYIDTHDPNPFTHFEQQLTECIDAFNMKEFDFDTIENGEKLKKLLRY